MSEQNQEASLPSPVASTFWGLIADVQDRIALTFGVRPSDREATVTQILARPAGNAIGYWLQLLLAMGIATLGLVLGSTAAVIGAMLISPLMSPIVELGMGLAVGSPLLVLRSVARTVGSIVAVVGCAALITIALPFQEVTPEIAARTSPTALDLLIAIFCAIAAAYTTIRPGSDTSGTAAGTAIGIALVPPLCVVGYGLGTSTKSISNGAALLFTANFCAILFFAVLCFLTLGYSRAHVAENERVELSRHGKGFILWMTRALRVVFGMKYGHLLRLLMPMFLLAFVAMPLGEALAQVTWQVRVRSAIQRILFALPENTVRSSFTVERDKVDVRLFTLGSAEEAAKLEKDLTSRIAAVAGTVPIVHVTAVADSSALEAVTAKLEASRAPLPPVAPKTPPLDAARVELGHVLADAWPEAAGKLVTTRLVFPHDAPLELQVVHLGPALGSAGIELLGERISHALGSEVTVRDEAISTDPVVVDASDPLGFLRVSMPMLERMRDAPELRACIDAPVDPSQKPSKEAEFVSATLRSLPAFEAKRITMNEGQAWRLVLQTEPCAQKTSPAKDEDAGAPDASANEQNR